MLDIRQKTGPNGFFTWDGHGKRPVPFGLESFTMANPGVKKPFWPVFYPANRRKKGDGVGVAAANWLACRGLGKDVMGVESMERVERDSFVLCISFNDKTCT